MAKFENIDGLNIAYKLSDAEQESPAVLFIHGNSSCKEAFAKQFESYLSEQYQFLAVDLPGHGESDNAVLPNLTYTIPEYANLLEKLLSKLQITQPVLVGWSLGGHIALEMVAQGYEVAGALITGTPPSGPGAERLTRGFLPYTFESAGSSDNPSFEEINEYTRAMYGSLAAVPVQLQDAARRTDGQSRSIMSEHWFSGQSGTPQADLVARFPVPIAVVHGQNDRFVDAAYLEDIAWNNLWQDEIFYFDSCGHAPFIEQPEQFNHYLSGFVDHCLAHQESTKGT